MTNLSQHHPKIKATKYVRLNGAEQGLFDETHQNFLASGIAPLTAIAFRYLLALSMSKESGKSKKKASFAFLKDPNLNDRQLLLFLMGQIVKLQAEIWTLQDLIVRQGGESGASKANEMTHFYFKQAIEEYERDVHLFRSSFQNTGEN